MNKYHKPNPQSSINIQDVEREIQKSSDTPKNNFQLVTEFLDENYKFRYNVISNELEYCLKNTNSEFKTANENEVYCHLRYNNYRISQSDLRAILMSHFVKEYNPIAEYFENLPEYKHESHISKLASYIKTENHDRFITHFKKALVRSVACAMNPDVFNKHCIVLVGTKSSKEGQETIGQHQGKTSFIRWLSPNLLKSYFVENIGVDKDGRIALCENFIVNMDELSHLDKYEINALKALLSIQFDKSRRPFDKKPFKRNRIATFWATTNNSEFLTDETGTVRWIVFNVTHINFKYSTELDVDRIWAEAFYLYKNGFPYELTKEEIEENELENKRFHVPTIEMELIQKHFLPRDKNNGEFYQSTDIMNKLLEIYPGKFRLNVQAIGKALKYLGYERLSHKSENNDSARWGYFIKLSNSTYSSY
ncbi:MAG: hypothetical protein KBB37_01485 [Bacteroidia bacterium]|nr:hypothetical protein [Bacteroidia bacterium]MBP9179440.1 hypothetical protein [Bacteroidia bacterium]MBP9723719.1 hypothetical protein [Bacteroidia bacterium]